MTMSFRIATHSDAPGIAQVLRSVWPDDTADPARIATATAQPNAHTLVALDDERIVGFVSGFTTVSALAERRLEVDLLAVAPSHQGRGIGRELVRHLTDMAADCDFARALIRIGNVGSERAFAACGYQVEPMMHTLFVADAQGQGDVAVMEGLHLVPVETCTYSGFWLEGQRTRDSLRAAPFLLGVEQGIVGAVIPADDVPALEPESAGYERIGDYRWWRHDYIGRC